MIRSNLNNLSNLKTKIESLAELGTREATTIIVSNIFHPSERKSLIVFSAVNLISNSVRKIIVIQ